MFDDRGVGLHRSASQGKDPVGHPLVLGSCRVDLRGDGDLPYPAGRHPGLCDGDAVIANDRRRLVVVVLHGQFDTLAGECGHRGQWHSPEEGFDEADVVPRQVAGHPQGDGVVGR